jgi:hypothetical protein
MLDNVVILGWGRKAEITKGENLFDDPFDQNRGFSKPIALTLHPASKQSLFTACKIPLSSSLALKALKVFMGHRRSSHAS